MVRFVLCNQCIVITRLPAFPGRLQRPRVVYLPSLKIQWYISSNICAKSSSHLVVVLLGEGKVSGTSPLSPSELLVALHMIEPSKKANTNESKGDIRSVMKGEPVILCQQ
jgi:hypothetical protein